MACASRDGLIAEQAAMLKELKAANAQLVERVAALERAAGRNSGNSSMPPSTDDLPGRTKPVGRRVKGSGRSRGKQPGAPGSTLAWVREPDEQIAHRPQGTCGCGVGCQNPTMASDQRFQDAGSYSLIRPPMTGQRRILPWIGSGTGACGRGGRSCRARCGRCRL